MAAATRLSFISRAAGFRCRIGREGEDSGKLKVVKTRDFDPMVRAWVVHRPPEGRLARPIKIFRDMLAQEFSALSEKV